MNRNIEEFALEILDGYDISDPPIDVFQLAEDEGIKMVPVSAYCPNFYAMIEFNKGIDEFVIYHPGVYTFFSNPILRFSIAHELGHFHIPEHRELLINGDSHHSQSGFICKAPVEREADQFAASLLIPEPWFNDKINEKDYKEKHLNLNDICDLAGMCQTSLTSMAIRYATNSIEPCGIVLSRDGSILNYIPSADADYLRFGTLGLNRDRIPPDSVTHELHRNPRIRDIKGGNGDSTQWYSDRHAYAEIYEEAFRLGDTGIILTLLTLRVQKNDEEDDFL